MNQDTATMQILLSQAQSVQKLVLLAYLSHQADDDCATVGVSRPGARLLAAYASVSRATVIRHRSQLEAAGVLVPTGKPRGRAPLCRIDFDALAKLKGPPKPERPPRRDFSVTVRRAVFDRAGGRCCLCGVALQDGWHLDHVVPLAKGGPDVEQNLQALCPPCNWSKGAS